MVAPVVSWAVWCILFGSRSAEVRRGFGWPRRSSGDVTRGSGAAFGDAEEGLEILAPLVGDGLVVEVGSGRRKAGGPEVVDGLGAARPQPLAG